MIERAEIAEAAATYHRLLAEGKAWASEYRQRVGPVTRDNPEGQAVQAGINAAHATWLGLCADWSREHGFTVESPHATCPRCGVRVGLPAVTEHDCTSRVCDRCGEREGHGSLFCTMSRDGEGPHRWMAAEVPLNDADRAMLQRVAVHLAQGAQER